VHSTQHSSHKLSHALWWPLTLRELQLRHLQTRSMEAEVVEAP